jgi:hypothetical protein
MNSTVEVCINKETKFPCLMVSKETNIIVLFHSKTSGVVVGNAISNTPLGYYSHCWAINYFIPFDGKIILFNV